MSIPLWKKLVHVYFIVKEISTHVLCCQKNQYMCTLTTKLFGHVQTLTLFHFYRPQRSWAKVMFLQASVILLTWGCLPQCMMGSDTPTPGTRHPSGADTPPITDIPPGTRHSPGAADTPWTRHPLHPGQTPPRPDTPQDQTLPPDQTTPRTRPPRPPPPRPHTPPPPPRSTLRHTVNERLVHVLLECILIKKTSSIQSILFKEPMTNFNLP